MTEQLLQLSEEVRYALDNNQPIIALESNIVSCSPPYSDAIKTAKIIETTIRSQGVVPASIAILEGKIHIGMDDNMMQYLAQTQMTIKASRRDLAFILSQRLCASLTVSATMYCANLAKIPLLVTGGLGGESTLERFDISADLLGLSSTPITVVCSGAKSIRDLPKTLEMLETQGVPVIGYNINEFPAFYSHSSGIAQVHRLDTPNEIARVMHYQHKLQLNNGIIIANSIPISAEIPDSDLKPIMKQAQHEAQHLNNKGITPFLLQRIAQLTAQQNLVAHRELMKSNALLGAKIAQAYKQQQKIL